MTDTRSKIRKMAERAAFILAGEPPEPHVLISRQRLYDLGDFQRKPEAGTTAQIEAWQLAAMSYTEKVRALLMLAPTGRWLMTVRGEGFRLLSPLESVSYGVDATLNKVSLAIDKGRYIVRNAAVTTSVGALAQAEAEIRLGAVDGAVKAAKRRAVRDQKVLSARGKTQDLRSVLEID